MVEEEGGVPVLTAGCLGVVGSEFQCRVSLGITVQILSFFVTFVNVLLQILLKYMYTVRLSESVLKNSKQKFFWIYLAIYKSADHVYFAEFRLDTQVLQVLTIC